MCGEVCSCNKLRRAHITLVVLHAVMGLHVDDVLRTVTELSTTLCTLSDLLPSVDTTVSPEITSLSKHLPTYITFVWSHSSMDALNMCGEIGLRREGLIAVSTVEWLLPSVHPAMCGQVSGVVRIVITHFTLVSALSTDVTVLPFNMTLQMFLCDALEGAVVAAEHGHN